MIISSIKKPLRWLGLPAAIGVAIAGIFLLTQPSIQKQLKDLIGNAFAANSTYTQPRSYADAVKRAAPAVVNIYTQQPHRIASGNPYSAQNQYLNKSSNNKNTEQSALGSGVIVSQDGYLLTNNHVIKGANRITVILHDGREAQAKLVGHDAETDLAVLKIELANLTAINLGNPADSQVGDIVLAIGNPFGVGQTVTQGIISATGRYGLGLNTYENFLQTDAAINPGNSGGALIDTSGKLLGINTAVLDKVGLASVGIGFAIPADTALKALADIIQHGSVVRGWLGIEARQMTPQLAQSLNTNRQTGVVITGIYNNGPAHIAGLRPMDIIIEIDNITVGDGRLSMHQIARLEPGAGTALTILRNGQVIQINAVVGTRPAPS